MTIESTLTKMQYQGNGATRVFPVPFPLRSNEHLRLFVTDTQTEQDTELAAGYEVVDSGTGDLAVAYPFDPEAPALGAHERLTLLRVLPLTQRLDLENGGSFDAEVIEGQFDVAAMQIQQLAEEMGRTPKLRPTSTLASITVDDIYEAVERIRQRAEEAARRAEEYGDCATLEAGLANLRGSWITPAAVASGASLDLPIHYYVGRNVLVLSMDGLLCSPASVLTDAEVPQYEEVGQPGELSRTVRLLFAAPAGAVWDALAIASNVSAYIEEQTRRAEGAAQAVDNAIANAGELAALEAVASVQPTIDAIYEARVETIGARDSALIAAAIAGDSLEAAERAQGAARQAQEAAAVAQAAAGSAQGGRNVVHLPGGSRALIVAEEDFTVPAYTVGRGDLAVYLDGLICVAGSDPARHQYEEVGAAGEASTVIRWHDDVPAVCDITIII